MKAARIPLALALLLLTLCHEVAAQEHQEFSIPEEMEDSLSSLAITPIEKPKELLKQIFGRLEQALQQKHEARRYLIKASYNIDHMPPFLIRAIFPVKSDNGLELSCWTHFQEEKNMFEEFHIESKDDLMIRDTTRLKLWTLENFEGPVHLYTNKDYNSRIFVYMPWLLGYKNTMKRYKVKVYSITDETGRGVYRVDFVDNKKVNQYGFKSSYTFNATAFFDSRTLRMTQFNRDFSYSSTQIPANRHRYQYDYEDRNGFPVLRQIKKNDYFPQLVIRTTIKLMDN